MTRLALAAVLILSLLAAGTDRADGGACTNTTRAARAELVA